MSSPQEPLYALPAVSIFFLVKHISELRRIHGVHTSATAAADKTALSNFLYISLALTSAMEDRSRKLCMVSPPERTRIPSFYSSISVSTGEKKRAATTRTDLNSVTAFPIAQFFSGLKLASMDACTMGTLRNSSPNIRRKGTKTPWSRPGPENPRPSLPRDSDLGVVRAGIPACGEKKVSC
jgi:hypothetical protein